MANQVMPNLLLKRAFLTPDRPAIQFKNETYSFKEVYEKSYQIAGQLLHLGLAKGEYAGVLLSNHADTAFIYLAFQLLDVKAVILNNRLTAEEIAWQLNDSKAVLGLMPSRTIAPPIPWELMIHRSLAAIPFAGRYRLIDFVLSNMVNANIESVAIFPKFQYRSLMDHLGSGKDWDLNRKRDGLFFFRI